MTAVDDTRPFPIQGGWDTAAHRKVERSHIPWWLAEIAYAEYARQYPGSAQQQSLERLAERGGFGRDELLMLLRGTK